METETVIPGTGRVLRVGFDQLQLYRAGICLLYTSDAADDLLCVDLGGRRLIQNKTTPGIRPFAPVSHLTQNTTITTQHA